VVRVAIAGSTGSIGKQTLDVVRAAGDTGDYQVVALSALLLATPLHEKKLPNN
jgi:1-deoxy-D-xylulose 5-phosphate reductoisomerase